MSDEPSDAEYEKMLSDHAKLKAALNGPRGAEVEQALDDFVDFPPKSGTIKE